MKYNRAVQHVPGDASGLRGAHLASRERQTPAIRLGLLLLLGLVPVTVFLSPNAPAASAAPAASLSIGSVHSCLVTTAGGVKCWGRNQFGQVGDATTSDRNVPVDVSGLTSGVAAIAAGDGHTCAVTTGGGIKCWGNNSASQLGDGTATNRTTPVDVSGLTSGMADVAVGVAHTCALTTSGGVKCWGNNSYGQLGDETTTDRTTAVDVSGLTSGVVAIATGMMHTCALTTGGGLKCWGRNYYGQLGDGTTTDRTTAVDVSGLISGVAAVSAGAHYTCARMTAGGVKCWGYNSYGQLGDGTNTDRTTAVDVSGLASGVTAITTGAYHTCAFTIVAAVKCWGYNSSGQLGDGTTGTNRTTPADVSGPTSAIAAIAAGGFHTCALTTAGGVMCWGNNSYGQLGDGYANRVVPVDVSGLSSGVAAVSAGEGHTCAVTTSGGAKCWGYNYYGQIGDGTTGTLRTTPADVSGLASGVSAIAAGWLRTCALSVGGGMKCWGWNNYGQLGDGTTAVRAVPVEVSGLTSGVAAIAANGGHTCALTTVGGVKCWGHNWAGQLGDGTITDRTTPADVFGLTLGVAAVATGDAHTCALTTAGGAKCWGYNGEGRLGDGTTTNRSTPVDVSGLTSGVAALASAGEGHTCALTTAGGVMCWGYNGSGQLGDGTTTNRTTAVDVAGLTSGVAAVSGGAHHNCALTTAGGVKCWGYNYYGQLGDGTTTDRTTAVDVSGLTSGVVAIATGRMHTCALTTGGGLKCWGDNGNGQLGDGTAAAAPVPVNVVGFVDTDSDGVLDLDDNCSVIANSGQSNLSHPTTFAGDHCEDPEADGIVDWVDNCPDDSNALQEDFDGDEVVTPGRVHGIIGSPPGNAWGGDACDADDDHDKVADIDEPTCGGTNFDGARVPERLDLPGDDDGDTLIDEPLPPGAETFDCDGDGYTGTSEAHVFAATNARDQDPCGSDAWPADFIAGGIPNSTNKVTITDLTSFLAPVRRINTSPPEPAFADRWDLVPGAGLFPKVINISDLTSIMTVAPPMLGGVRAFNGPVCPWPP